MSVSTATDRSLTNARARRFMLAIQDVMGQSGLTTVLRQAGLQRYASALPAADEPANFRASEYAALMQAIENYYGRGARGTLIRIGYASFKRLVASRRLRARAFHALLRPLPPRARRLLVLRWLATQHGRGGKMRIHQDDHNLVLVDMESLATTGRTRDNQICWVTLGEIQEALKWGTGREYDVTEMSCKAKGEPACRFEIGAPVG
jgi:predicted hydrocarbon binding protein